MNSNVGQVENLVGAGMECMEVLTVVVSDDIGNVDLAVGGFRPHASMQDAGVGVPQGGQTRHSNVTVYLNTVLVTVCRE